MNRGAMMTISESIAQQPPSVWRVLWTQSHCEQLVHDQLASRGFDPFLPKVNVWSSRAGQRHLVRRPMFPGYLFLRHAMDKKSYIEVRQARGLVAVLGETWEKLAVVPDAEVDSVRALAQSDLPCMPHPYLKEGMRVRVLRGPLAGVEGILQKKSDQKGLLVLSVDLLSSSVAVQVDCTAVDRA